MSDIKRLPLTPQQAELAIDGLTGRLVAQTAITRALLGHIIAIAPDGIEVLRTRLQLQAADSQEELQGESESCRQQFLEEVAAANRLIDRLQQLREQQ